MTDPATLAQERELILANLANGVPEADIGAAFNRTPAELQAEIKFIGRKLKEFRFRRGEPPIDCDTIANIRFNRRIVLKTLSEMASHPGYLAGDFIWPKIDHQKIDSPDILGEAARRLQKSPGHIHR